MRTIVERRVWTIPVEGSLSYNQIYNRVVQDFPKADDGMVLWIYDDGFEIKDHSIPNLISFVKDPHQFQISSHLGDLRIAHLISPGMRMEVHAARLFTLIEVRNYQNATPGWTRGVFRDGQAALE